MSRPLYYLNQVRNYARGIPRFWNKEKKLYGLIKYYPRHPNEVDPPIKPTKLLMVQRVKPYYGNPYWDKAILDSLKLNEKKSAIAVVKNIPEVCVRLWKIKHLIKVTPINLPENLPDDDDARATWLHENGDLLVMPRPDPAREQSAIDHQTNPKRLDGTTLGYELRMRWLNPWDT